MTDASTLKQWFAERGTTAGAADRDVEQAAVWNLSTVLAHELRNPLSSIKGAAQILLQEWGDQKPHSEFLAIILDEVEALTDLTTEFLEYARPFYPELTWAHWNDVVLAAVSSVQPAADSADITFVMEMASDLPGVLLDVYQMEHAIQNVLLNAVEASHRGGCVYVRTFEAEGSAIVSVTDEGSGVPLEHIPRLFVPFFTTKLTGTGLGLPMARKIACQHGGDVTVTPNDGPGITVMINVPASGES